jgi:hypothetical protein
MRRARAVALFLMLHVLLAAAVHASDDALTLDQIEEFLLKAKVISAKPIGKGITHPWRLTLSDGVTTHDAAFQSVDRKGENVRFQTGRTELVFRDYYGYNIAAYRLARVLGCDDLVPASVERSWKGKRGAYTWWIPKKWDEDERQKAGVEPSDRLAWEQQVYRARVFTALLDDTDRNLGNQLVTEDFHLWLIDFTRAFRLSTSIDKPGFLRRIDRRLFDRLREVSSRDLTRAMAPHVGSMEAQALIVRRDAIVAHFTRIAAERSEDSVFY